MRLQAGSVAAQNGHAAPLRPPVSYVVEEVAPGTKEAPPFPIGGTGKSLRQKRDPSLAWGA